MAIKLLKSFVNQPVNTIVKDLSYDVEDRLVKKAYATFDLAGGVPQQVPVEAPFVSGAVKALIGDFDFLAAGEQAAAGISSLVAAPAKIPIANSKGMLDSSWKIEPLSKVRPSYKVDFTASDTLPADWVCVRATASARVNAFGKVESVPPNTAKIEYDSSTGECLGLRRDPVYANGFVGSEKFNALPSSDTTANITLGTDATNPIGATEVAIVKPVTPRASFYQYGIRSAYQNARNIFSFFYKPVSNIGAVRGNTSASNGFYFDYNLATKQITIGVNTLWLEVFEFADGWLRFSVCQKGINTDANLVLCVMSLAIDANLTAEFRTTGYQLHSGVATMPYLKSDTAAVSSSSDRLYTPLGNWFNKNGGEGTLVVSLDVLNSTNVVDDILFGCNQTSTLISGQDYGFLVYSGFVFLTRNPTSVAPQADFQQGKVKIAVSISSSGKRICKSGGQIRALSGSGFNDVSLATVLSVGGNGTATVYAKDLAYYPRALSDADMYSLVN